MLRRWFGLAILAALALAVDDPGDLYEILDEKNKDIADLAQELREVKEKLMKLRAYEKNH